MKRKFSSLILLSAFVVALFSVSCSGSKSQGGDYVNVIPQNSLMIVSFNVGEIASKSELFDSKILSSILLPQVQGMFEDAAYNKLKSVLEDLNESGIDVSAPGYFAACPDGVYDAITPMFVAKVSDEDKLRESIELLVETSQEFSEIENKGDFKYLYADGVSCGFNNTTFVIVENSHSSTDDEALVKLEKLLGQTAKESIATTGKFQALEDMNGDVKFLLDYDFFGYMDEEYKDVFYSAMPDVITEDDEIAVIVSLEFRTGEIVLEVAQYTDSKTLDDYYTANNYLVYNKGTFLANIPADAIAVVSMGVDGAKVAKEIKNNKVLGEMMRNDRQMKVMVDQAADFMPDLVGDITLAVTGVEEGRNGDYPMVVAMVELANTKTISSLLGALPMLLGNNLKMLSSRDFAISGAMMNYALGNAIYFGYTDNSIYISNDDRYAGDANYKTRSSVASSDFASDMKSSYFAATVDLQSIAESDIMSSRRMRDARDILENLDRVELTLDKTMKIRVLFRNDDVNSVAQIASICFQSMAAF